MKLSHKQAIVYSVSGILILFALSLILAYMTPFRDPVSKTFKRIYPSAVVGTRLISVNDMEEARAVAGMFGVSATDAEERQLNIERSIILARSLKLATGNDQIADETLYYTKGNETEYKNLLQRFYGGSERLFYKHVIIPQVTDAQLRVHYNSQIESESAAYEKAQAVLDRLSKGEKFEDLAKTESADKATAALGGDLGFYEAGQILPELDEQVSISATGEIRKDIITSRLGYHIIYPVEYSTNNGKKTWHVKHILFPTEGYEQWLERQLSGISAIRIQK